MIGFYMFFFLSEVIFGYKNLEVQVCICCHYHISNVL